MIVSKVVDEVVHRVVLGLTQWDWAVFGHCDSGVVMVPAPDGPRMGTDDESGTTIGVWIGPGDQKLLTKFDAQLVSKPGNSRSDCIKRAMADAVEIDKVLENADIEFPSDRERRHWIRQALLDMVAEERE